MQQTAQSAAGATTIPSLATTIVPGDQILVTLTAEKRDKSRVALSYAFNHEGRQVDNKGNVIGGRSLELFQGTSEDEPVFPAEEYAAALVRGRQAGNNDGEADRIIADFKDQMEAYQSSGGAPQSDRIGTAIFSFLEAEAGVKATDHDGLVLKPEEVVVRAPVRRSQDEPGLWVVQLAPTWG